MSKNKNLFDESNDPFDYENDYPSDAKKRRSRGSSGFSVIKFLRYSIILSAIIGVIVLLITLRAGFGGLVDIVRDVLNLNEPVYTIDGGVVVLDSVVQLAELTTSQNNFNETITIRRDIPYVLGALYRDNLFYSAVGRIDAGIDLSQMTEADVIQDGQTITLRLPAPNLMRCYIDEALSGVTNRNLGLFSTPSSESERAARLYALGHFRDVALERGILEEANVNAVETLETFLNSLPIAEDVQFTILTTAPDLTNLTLPTSCQTPE
jgi:hypothetical protein